MKKDSIQTLNENENNLLTNENVIHNENAKVKFNFLDLPNKKDIALKTKLSVKSMKSMKSMKSSRSKLKKHSSKANHFGNINNKEPKTKFNQLCNLNLTYEDIPLAKSSHNVNKCLLGNKTTITKSRITKTKSQYDSYNNNKRKSNKVSNLDQTKYNFLKLITRTNDDNNILEYNRSKFSNLNNQKLIEIYEGDDLTKLEKTLQNKIMSMEKEVEFMEFEINPVDMLINQMNIRKKKKKFTIKKAKEFEKKKIERNKKFITTTINKKKLLSQISSSNSNQASSENIVLKSNQFLDDSKMNLNEKKNVGSNMLSSKLKFSSSNNKKSKYRSEKGSNKLTSNFANNSNKNSGNSTKKAKIKETLTGIFGKNDIKNNLPQNETLINKSKTYSNIDSKIGQTLMTNTESMTKTGSISSEKEIVFEKEKFRVLIHKKLVYDSLDDEELVEDVITDNFYFEPNSIIVILVDTMVLILTFWSMLYKPLYIVLNNCDIQNTITSVSFNNISNLFIDILFICDLIINFFKSYYNFDEQLITKSYRIFLHYCKKFFIVDLISAIPFYTIIKFIALNRYLKHGITVTCSEYYNHQINDTFQILEVLKLIKILKCISRNNIVTNYILNELNYFTFFENWSSLIFNLFLFLLLLHLTACIHIFISCTAFPNWIILNNLHYSSFSTIYLSSIYFLVTTVTSVGYGDIIGKSFTEYCFQIVLLLVGIIAYSWLISSISEYVKENNKQNEIFDKKISILNEIKLEHPNMKKELYDKIYLHLEYINLKQKKDKSSLIDSLPHSITKTLLFEMYRPIIENFHFFKNFKNSEFINRVISKLKPIIAVKNDILFDQGEIIEESFFVKQGRLSLEVKIDTIHPEKSVQKLLDEEYFFGVENNKLYQKNAFSLMKMTSVKQTVLNASLNKKNLYDLYSKRETFDIIKKEIKSVSTDDQGKGKVRKHLDVNLNYVYLKILDIRKNEHFGALLMFLNKRSPLSLRVKTKKAELYFLKKIDAIEISSSYPNIWKRVNRASFHNLKQIKKIMHKIIIHYCETYGINFMKKICNENEVKNVDELQKIYTMQTKLTKDIYNKDFSVINDSNNNIKIPNKLTSLVSKSQLKMLKEFINNTKISKNTKEENFIKQQVIRDLDISNPENNEKSPVSSAEYDSPLNCTLNVNKGIKDISKKEKSSMIYDDNKNDKNILNEELKDNEIKKEEEEFSEDNNKSKDSKNSNESKYSRETKTKDGIIQNNNTKYGKEITKKLFKNYGTPFYPEDVNDEIYSQEKYSKNSDNKSNNSNAEELEYTPVNYLLSSQDSIKNNYIQTIREFSYKKINGINNKTNNVTINNNFITNNVINNIQPGKIKSNEYELSQFHFSLNYNNKNCESSNKMNQKKYNLSISKNSFELLAFGRIDNDYTNSMSKYEIEIKKKGNKPKTEYRINKKTYKESESDSSFSSSSNSKEKQKIPEKSYTCAIPVKKGKKQKSSSSSFSSSSSNNNIYKYKGYKICTNKILHYKSEYFNLNQLTKGRFANNKNFQNEIKNIILDKIADLKHSRIELPRVKTVLKIFNSNKALPSVIKKSPTKKFSHFQPSNKLRNSKIKNSIAKNQRSNFYSSSELNDRGRGSITKKKINRKTNNNDSTLLNYVNRNIRDDSAALNNPGKFYNGLFNDMMKKYSKANIKPIQK